MAPKTYFSQSRDVLQDFVKSYPLKKGFSAEHGFHFNQYPLKLVNTKDMNAHFEDAGQSHLLEIIRNQNWEEDEHKQLKDDDKELMALVEEELDADDERVHVEEEHESLALERSEHEEEERRNENTHEEQELKEEPKRSN
jgi:hypothetical protein